MRLWRLCQDRFTAGAFSGEGARRYGGRWNSKGTSVVYTATHLSLCVLEVFVHLDAEDMPEDYVAIAADVPDDASMQTLDVATLPKNWRDTPGPQVVKDLGDAWVVAGTSLALLVPSVVIPAERGCLLNPAHPEFKRVRVHPPEPFRFDPRLWK